LIAKSFIAIAEHRSEDIVVAQRCTKVLMVAMEGRVLESYHWKDKGWVMDGYGCSSEGCRVRESEHDVMRGRGGELTGNLPLRAFNPGYVALYSHRTIREGSWRVFPCEDF